ncbi:hypothetical protein HOY80DRAFT_962903 [Tuber brumale]|nr:hypothetical protein HOY80DRAFT_962903 [Tuber brumale]
MCVCVCVCACVCVCFSASMGLPPLVGSVIIRGTEGFDGEGIGEMLPSLCLHHCYVRVRREERKLGVCISP